MPVAVPVNWTAPDADPETDVRGVDAANPSPIAPDPMGPRPRSDPASTYPLWDVAAPEMDNEADAAAVTAALAVADPDTSRDPDAMAGVSVSCSSSPIGNAPIGANMSEEGDHSDKAVRASAASAGVGPG